MLDERNMQVGEISNINKHRKNMPNREVQRLPKGGWGVPRAQKIIALMATGLIFGGLGLPKVS